MGVAVTDDMIARAFDAWDREMLRRGGPCRATMRAALEAALDAEQQRTEQRCACGRYFRATPGTQICGECIVREVGAVDLGGEG